MNYSNSNNNTFTPGLISPGPDKDEPTTITPPIISNWDNFLTHTKEMASSGIYKGLEIDAFQNEFTPSINSDPMMNVLFKAQRESIDSPPEGNEVLSKDQIDTYKKDRPGLELPDGVRKISADVLSEDYDQNQYYSLLLKHASPGIIGKVTGWAGDMLGASLTSPVASAVAVGVGALTDDPLIIPSVFGAFRSEAMNALVNSAVRRSVAGAAGGAAYSGVKETEEAFKDSATGDSFSPLVAAYDITQNALLGGFLYPFAGFIKDKGIGTVLNTFAPATTDNLKDIAQTTLNFVKQGKDTNVGLAMKNMYVRASNRLKDVLSKNNIDPDIATNNLDDAANTLDEESNNIKNTLDELNKKETLSDDEKSQADNIKKRMDEIETQKRSIEVVKSLITNPDSEIKKDEMDSFINSFKNGENDYANGRGQENLDVTGPDYKDAQNLVSDEFSDEDKEDLAKNVPMSKEEKLEYEKIKEAPERLSVIKTHFNNMINCILGSST